MPGKLKSGALEPMASVPGSLRPNANEGKQSIHKRRQLKKRQDLFIFKVNSRAQDKAQKNYSTYPRFFTNKIRPQ